MNLYYLRHLAIFVVVLIALNFLFHLHIAILGSLALTVLLTWAFNVLQRR